MSSVTYNFKEAFSLSVIYPEENEPNVSESSGNTIESNSEQVVVETLPGAAKAKGILLVWSKKALFLTYAWIWVCFFLLSFQSSIATNTINYAYADFSAAPQINTSLILSYIIGGVLQLPIGRILTVWGRTEGLLIFLFVYVIGLIVSASCTGPNSFAAGYVLYWVGYLALNFILSIYVADMSGLQNRGLALAFIGTPAICTAFTGPLAAESFIKHSSWRWAYGSFAIIQVFAFVPLSVVFKLYERKALRAGFITDDDSGRTKLQSIIHYAHEFDIVGGFLLMAAFILFLLPFSLASYGRSQYKSATFIAMVLIGILLFPAFGIWEKYFAKSHFIKWELFKDRTVLGACVLSACLFFNFYCWDAQFFNFLIVVYDLTVPMTGYMLQIYAVGSSIWAVFFGFYIRRVNRFKWACLGFGLPLMMLGAGLMIRFRGQDSNIGYIIMCQIFIAFAGGTLIIGDEVAAMCAASLGEVPMIISLLGLWSSLGGAIGSAVATAIYTNTFPTTLYSSLPDSAKPNATEIYLGGYTAQMAFPVGSDIRNAINLAWGQTQRNCCIAALCILVLAIPAIAVWKDYDVKMRHQEGNFI